MSIGATPCLTLAIAPLSTGESDSFATWVTHSPLPGGYVHHDSRWSETLTRKWLNWQEMFSLQREPHLPVPYSQPINNLPPLSFEFSNSSENYGGRLMQELGISLWQWLFTGPINQSFAQSRGIALGKHRPLRLRLEIRDPDLIPLPWEIMQPEAGNPAISLNPQILFSRTTSNVDPLVTQQSRDTLTILLVLGEKVQSSPGSLKKIASPKDYQGYPFNGSPGWANQELNLDAEAANLAQLIEQSSLIPRHISPGWGAAPVTVHPLVQPSPEQLTEVLDSGLYNVVFYAGHGMPAPDGGLLFLCPDGEINGTELAQILVRNRVTLAVFNACWGAQPDHQGTATLERSSLAEVLIHHGVPAVVAMRDSIADREALSFIQSFTKILAQRKPIDEALRFARQQLLTLYKFNQPAWTLPILYMHPEFEGELLPILDQSMTEGVTEIPVNARTTPVAYLRSQNYHQQNWPIYGGLMRVGRRQENDIVIYEKWVSQRHAEIICRESNTDGEGKISYFLRDFSRFGTFILGKQGWQKVHQEEVPLTSGTQIRFGSLQGQILEFFIENSTN